MSSNPRAAGHPPKAGGLPEEGKATFARKLGLMVKETVMKILLLLLFLSMWVSGCGEDRSVRSVIGDSVSAITIETVVSQPSDLPRVVVRIKDQETIRKFLACEPLQLGGLHASFHRPVRLTFDGTKFQAVGCEDFLDVMGPSGSTRYHPPPGFFILVRAQVDLPEDVRARLSGIAASVLEAWLKENPVDADQISGAKVDSILIEDQGIEVVLSKGRGSGPEGESTSYFHVHMDRSFRVLKTVRGPDVST